MSEVGIAILDAIEEADISKIDALFQSSSRDILEVTPSEKWNWLHKCLQGYDSDEAPAKSIDFLISKGIPINAQDMYGMTPLHYAVRSHNVDAVRLLLQAGANPNLQNQDGDHALRQAVLKLPREEDLPIFELLVKHGVDINKPNNNGVSTLDVLRAGTKRPQSIVDFLEEAEQKHTRI